MTAAVIEQNHEPRPIEHVIRMMDVMGTTVSIEWVGEADTAFLNLSAKDDEASVTIQHIDLEAYFEAYLVSRGYIVSKSERRVIAERRAATDASAPQLPRLDAGLLDAVQDSINELQAAKR